jgi:protein-disulfide isomerase|tara:strand:+ start:534 stop:1127 length:594 start_codon:yes stop_codon:yes gene_type:complete
MKRLLFFITLIFFFNNLNLYSSENKGLTSIGNKEAKITVKVFSSLSCPHCAHFHVEVFNKLKKEFIDTNQVKFEHHSFPLDLQALNAEKILKCFEDNTKKFSFLNQVYSDQESWYRGKDINSINLKLIKIAKNYNLNSDKINTCLNDENLEDEILNERIKGNKKYSITSTPTIFINEKKYEGKHKYENFRKEIKKLL